MSHEAEVWENVDSESSEDRSLASDSGVSPRKRTVPTRMPASTTLLSPSKDGPRGKGQRPLSGVRAHMKRPPSRPGRWKSAVSSAFFFSVIYVSEIFRVALVWLRRPLSLILVGYSLALLMSYLQQTVTESLQVKLGFLCIFPGISRLWFCQLPRSNADLSIARLRNNAIPMNADFPALVNIQSASFEHLLDESVGGASLALEIKKAEMATSDLSTLVRVSSLTSKDKIAETLDVFVDAARHTARGLQRFSAKVGGAVDGIVAVNDYALRQIEADVSTKSSSDHFWPSIWTPFSRRTSLASVTKSFTQTMGVLESELHILILAAEASLHDFDVLEEQLRLLHAIVSREDLQLNISKQELLSNLWTILGGNRAELNRFESHLELLSGLSEYRRHALAHVVGALHTLQTMSAELEALRGRVSQPVMLGDIIPLEVHVKSIRGGLDRLIEGRKKVKRIEDARYAKLLEPLQK